MNVGVDEGFKIGGCEGVVGAAVGSLDKCSLLVLPSLLIGARVGMFVGQMLGYLEGSRVGEIVGARVG